jgi:hypothetical protein
MMTRNDIVCSKWRTECLGVFSKEIKLEAHSNIKSLIFKSLYLAYWLLKIYFEQIQNSATHLSAMTVRKIFYVSLDMTFLNAFSNLRVGLRHLFWFRYYLFQFWTKELRSDLFVWQMEIDFYSQYKVDLDYQFMTGIDNFFTNILLQFFDIIEIPFEFDLRK